MVTVNRPLWDRLTRLRMEDAANEDSRFVLQHWHEVSVEAAAAVAPYNSTPEWLTYWQETAEDYALLRCDKFDYATRQCTAYEDRPPVCRDFPAYGGTVQPHTLWRLGRCGYWGDIKREEWPDFVDIVELAKAGVT